MQLLNVATSSAVAHCSPGVACALPGRGGRGPSEGQSRGHGLPDVGLVQGPGRQLCAEAEIMPGSSARLWEEEPGACEKPATLSLAHSWALHCHTSQGRQQVPSRVFPALDVLLSPTVWLISSHCLVSMHLFSEMCVYECRLMFTMHVNTPVDIGCSHPRRRPRLRAHHRRLPPIACAALCALCAGSGRS